MRLRHVLPCALVVAFASSAGAAGRTSGAWYTYLVAPSGHMVRVISIARGAVAADKQITMMVTYAADSPEVATVVREAGEIAAALGPELEAAGHSGLAVQAKFGWDPRQAFSTSVTYGVVFVLQDGRWVRRPPEKEDPEKVKGADAHARSPDDPAFPFDRPGVDAAAKAAESWMRLLDDGSEDVVLASMSRAYRAQTESSLDRWRELNAKRRSACSVGDRLERYRMQTRMKVDPMPPDGVVLVQYEFRSAKGGRCLEQVAMMNEKGGWRPAGYRFRPIPGTK